MPIVGQLQVSLRIIGTPLYLTGAVTCGVIPFLVLVTVPGNYRAYGLRMAFQVIATDCGEYPLAGLSFQTHPLSTDKSILFYAPTAALLVPQGHTNPHALSDLR